MNPTDDATAMPADSAPAALDIRLSLDRPALQQTPRISAAWLIVPCLACDFLMMPVFTLLQGPPAESIIPFATGILGCVIAQGNLLAAYLVWGEGPFLRRLITHWKIAAGLYLLWLLGVAISRVPDWPIFAATIGLGVPLVSIAAQFPLWIARQWFGWRLVKENAVPAESIEPPLTIRDLMLATVIVAIALALARIAPADGKNVWPVWTIGFAIASIISSISLLPAGVLLLRRPLFSLGLVWGILYAASYIVLLWIIVAILWWYSQALAPRAIYVAISTLMATFASTLLLAATIARSRGYRLIWGRRGHPSNLAID